MADDAFYWRIEIEIDIEFDQYDYEFSIEESSLLDDDFNEWLNSVQYKDEDEEEGDDGE